MRKFRSWIINKFLPAWAKEFVYQENERLRDEIIRLNSAIAERDAYIDGLERGIRSQRRIIINTGGKQQ